MIEFKHLTKTAVLMLCLPFWLSSALASNEPSDSDAVLDLTDMGLEDLLTIDLSSVMKSHAALKDTPAPIYIISQADIRRIGATTIPEALRIVPGLHVARVDSNKWAISSRGFNAGFADKLLVLMDGRSIYTPFFSGTWWDQEDLPMDDIERIEIIRGPGASIWGANAVNGVINIVTKNAKDTQGALISAFGGNMRSGGGVRYGSRFNDGSHLRLYARHSNYDEAKLPNSKTDAGDNGRLSKIGFRWDKTGVDGEEFELQGSAFIGFSGGYRQAYPSMVADELPVTNPPYMHLDETDVSYSGHHLQGRWHHQIDADSSTALRFYWSRNERKADWIGASYQSNTLDLDFQHSVKLNAEHYLTWGTGARLNINDAENSLHFAWEPQHRIDDIYSLFVQDEISLVPKRWTLTLGSKLQHNPVTYFEWQPNARLSWTPNQHHSFWAAVSRAVHTPSWWEQDAHYHTTIRPPLSGGNANPVDPATLIILKGNKNLQSEKLLAYELGWRSQLNRALSADVSLFYYDYHHITTISPQLTDASHIGDGYLLQTVSYFNQALVDIYGGEVSLDWQVNDDWKLRASYSFAEKISKPYKNATANTLIPNCGTFPNHQAMLWSMYQFNPEISFDLNWRFVDAISVNSQAVRDYHELDARLAWQLMPGLELSVVGRNLLQKQHLEFGSEFFTPASAIQREIFAHIRWQF